MLQGWYLRLPCHGKRASTHRFSEREPTSKPFILVLVGTARTTWRRLRACKSNTSATRPVARLALPALHLTVPPLVRPASYLSSTLVATCLALPFPGTIVLPVASQIHPAETRGLHSLCRLTSKARKTATPHSKRRSLPLSQHPLVWTSLL